MSKRSDDGIEEAIVGILGLATVITIFIAALVSLTFILPALAVGGVLFGGVYYYYHSPSYLENKARIFTEDLYQRVKATTPLVPTDQEFGQQIVNALPDHAQPILHQLALIIFDLYHAEQFQPLQIPPPPALCNSIEGARYRDLLSQVSSRSTNTIAAQDAIKIITEAFQAFLGSIPHPLPSPSKNPLTVPLVTLLDDPGKVVEDLIVPFYTDTPHNLFTPLRAQIDKNLDEVSRGRSTQIFPSDYEGDDVAYRYLKGTPFLPLFDIPIEFDFAVYRDKHTHIIGGAGSGKTQLLSHLIVNDLSHDRAPGMVVVDSHGDLIAKLSRLDCFDPDSGRHKGKLILIDPRDTAHPVALNIFDYNQERFKTYSQADREQVMAGILQSFDYLFTMIGAETTPKQTVLWRNLVRLLLTLPDTLGRAATMLDLLAILDNVMPYLPAIAALPPLQRQFFERHFPATSSRQSDEFKQTKEQIRYRLHAILENPTLARMFTGSERNRLDLFTELNHGSIILIDTAQDFLKDGTSYLGRIFISLVLQAALERAVIPEHERRHTYLIVDEAAQYFDSNMDDLLTQVRKYRVGCLFAHQYLDQCTPTLRASLNASTTIKLAGGVSAADARALGHELRTTPDFILAQRPLNFACFVRGLLSRAISVSVPYGTLENHPKMSKAAYQKFRELNRRRIAGDVPKPAAPPRASKAIEDSDPTEWR